MDVFDRYFSWKGPILMEIHEFFMGIDMVQFLPLSRNQMHMACINIKHYSALSSDLQLLWLLPFPLCECSFLLLSLQTLIFACHDIMCVTYIMYIQPRFHSTSARPGQEIRILVLKA